MTLYQWVVCSIAAGVSLLFVIGLGVALYALFFPIQAARLPWHKLPGRE